MPKEVDVEEFPQQLQAFAVDIANFLKSLNEFPEFTDEVVNNSMNSFEADLKVSYTLNKVTSHLLTNLSLVLGLVFRDVRE